MPAPHPKLHRDRSLVLVVDVQDRLTPAMPPETLARLVKYGRALIHAGNRLGLPVLATEQYPKGLGRTIPELRELLPEAPLEKVHFSCGADPLRPRGRGARREGRARGGPEGPRARARACVRVGDRVLRGREDRPGGRRGERSRRLRHLEVTEETP